MTRDEAIERIRRHRDELADMHVASLALFGSVARNKAGPESDVDLLVEFDRPVGLFEFVALKQRLTEILGARVDLVTRKGLKPQLRDGIEAEAVRAA